MDSKDERDRERDQERERARRERESETRERERDELEKNREREADRDRERDVTSRRVTEAKSQVRPRGVGGSKRTLHEGAFGGTPTKRQQPETVSSHTSGAKPREPVVRYCGTESSDTGRGGQALLRKHQTSDRVHVSHERRRLFENDVIDTDKFTNHLIRAADEAQPAEISKLISIMGKQQLASSLQHMVMKWKELKESRGAGTQQCRSSTSDSQLLRPANGTHRSHHHAPQQTETTVLRAATGKFWWGSITPARQQNTRTQAGNTHADPGASNENPRW